MEVVYEALPARGISENTCKRFKYGVAVDGPLQVAQYGSAQKTRSADKEFRWVNRPSEGPELFGQSLWKSGGRQLVITEGEIDALSYAEATECKWPVVSVPDGAGDAPRAIKRNLEFVDGFDKVIFMFDMDDPGQEAAEECAALLPPGKAYIALLPLKDPNEILLNMGAGELYKTVFNAKAWRPDGIVEGVDLVDVVMTPPAFGLSYPWTCLDGYLYGQRTGEMTTWVAGTGIGKSQVVREVTYHLWKTHGERVGVIALEESNRDSAIGQISLELGAPLHLPDARERVGEDSIAKAAPEILKGFAFYDHWGSVDADVLLPKIRYMAHTMGIRWFVLDHLSIMVSGSAAEGDERKRLDQLVTQIRSMLSELDIGLHIVSHLRKASGTPHEEGGQVSLQDIRSSGALGQMSNSVIALERNQQAEDGTSNVTLIRVLKNRYAGLTGPVGALEYSHETNRMLEVEIPSDDSDYEEREF